MRFAAVLLGSLLMVAACGASAATATPTVPPDSTFPPGPTIAPVASSPAVRSSSPAANTPAPAAGSVPASCDELLTAVSTFTGSISATQSLGKPQHLSCEYEYAGGKSVIIVTIGAGGTLAAYNTLKAGTATGGRKVTDVPDLGVAAFSVAKGGKPGGVTSLGTNEILYVVESILDFNQDIELIRVLMQKG